MAPAVDATRRRITVLGTGYLGTAHAACLAEMGFEVLGIDVDPLRVGALTRGDLPFYEPGLEALLQAGLASGRLSFSTSYTEAAAFADVHFVCVGTPQREASYAADLSQVDGCIDTLGPLLDRPCLVIGKSTVPVGTAEILAARLARIAPGRDHVRARVEPGVPARGARCPRHLAAGPDRRRCPFRPRRSRAA